MAIRILAHDVISKIAAGEVVERPASVVKELIENSVDAGASEVVIEACGGGVSLIRVVDDGVGIPSGEVELAFERHATSKIGSPADLDGIATLGFRGEALPSIAAVAWVEVLTLTEKEMAGSYIGLREGVVVERGRRGRSRGTTITVRNLFHSTPARLKFLKSVATENSRIINLVSQYALAFPEVRFALSVDGRATMRTSGSGKLRDVLVEVYGMEIAQEMMEVRGMGEGEVGMMAMPLRVTGLVSPPSLSRSSRGYLSFFVNRRWINSWMLARAVEEAYQGWLPQGKHPIAVINISLPLDEVDVNVHPTKSEVKFRREHMIFGAINSAVKRALTKAPVPKITAVAPIAAPPREPDQASGAPEKVEPRFVASLPILRVLGQLANSYIIAEGPEGLYLIDQHAAHERVLFDRFCAQRSQRQLEVQGLLEPLTIEVSPEEEQLLKSQREALAEFGLTIEPFGGMTYVVRTVPALLPRRNLVQEVRGILESLIGDSEGRNWDERITISLACHGAVRAGQALSDEEMRELVRQLEQTAQPRTCPHGRPTMIHLSSWQLEKEFGRT